MVDQPQYGYEDPRLTIWPPQLTWPTKTPRPTYIPIWPTKTPRPTYIPIWPTKDPRRTRSAYTTYWATRTPVPTLPTPTNANTIPGCNEVCVDAEQNHYCCNEEEKDQCPAQTGDCSVDRRRDVQSVCKLDSDCEDNRRCCFDACKKDFVCMEVKEKLEHPVRKEGSGETAENQ
nr:protein psiA-like [Penaeus vannamei]